MLRFLLLLVLSNVVHAQEKPFSFEIEGKIAGLNEPAIVWLGLTEPYENKGMAIRSEVKNGNFFFRGSTYHPTLAKLSLFLLNKEGKPKLNFPEVPKLDFFLCSAKTYISISDSFRSMEINEHCHEQQLLESLNKRSAATDEELAKLHEQQFQAYSVKDMKHYQQLSLQISRLNKSSTAVLFDFIKKNNSSWLSLVLLLRQSRIFSDDSLTRLYGKLAPQLKNSLSGKELARQMDLRKNPAKKWVGQSFPLAALTGINEYGVDLGQFKGKYLLIDFWASWCGPCRAKHPALKNLYEVQKKKLDIISISIDREKSKWEEAVRTDAMPWHQLLDSNESVFKQLRAEKLPFSILMDPDGKIIEIDPSAELLQTILKK